MTERHLLVWGAQTTGEASPLFDSLDLGRQAEITESTQQPARVLASAQQNSVPTISTPQPTGAESPAVARRHDQVPAEAEAAPARSALRNYEADIPGPYLDDFVRRGGEGEQIIQRAEAYLGRLELLHTLLETYKIGMACWVRKEVAFKYQTIPLTREALMRIQNTYTTSRSYNKEGIIAPWMVRGSVNAYEDEASHVRALNRMRNLMQRGYFMETADPLLIEKRESGLVDRKLGKGVVATDAFLSFEPGEGAAIMHTYDLYGFLGQYPLSADRITTWWGIADPQSRAELLIPYVDKPSSEGKALTTVWSRLRYRLINGFEQHGPLERSDTVCKTVMAQLRHKEQLQDTHDLSAPAVVNCIRHAIAALDRRRGGCVRGTQRAVKLIEHYLWEVSQVGGVQLPDEERYAAVLRFGPEYYNRVIDSGSERLIAYMTAQALTAYGSGAAELKSGSVQLAAPPASPSHRTVVHSAVPVAPPVPPPLPERLSAVPELPEESPKTTPPENSIYAPETESIPVDTSEEKVLDDFSRVRLPYQVIKELPHPERAAIYIAHCLPWLFDKSMRREHWHDVNRVLLHFDLNSRGELIDFVQGHLMPGIREKVQGDQDAAGPLTLQHILAALNSR